MKISPSLKQTVVLLTASVAWSQTQFVTSPAKVERGRSYPLDIQAADCKNEPLKGAEVKGTASGLSLSEQAVSSNGCALSAKLAVGDTAIFGRVRLPIIAKNGSESKLVGFAEFEVVPIQPEPNPPGLDPEVDVAWKVLDWQSVADSFGRKVANQYFGIDIALGNNTGYPIQLAGVFFDQHGKFDQRDRKNNSGASPIPNDPYHIVRSTIERNRETGARAVLMNSLSLALGVLPGFGAFFSSTKFPPTALLSARDRYSLFLGALNPFTLGLGILVPDKTVRHLIAVDTRAVRENLLVPQNTSVRILTFVSRGSVEGEGCAAFKPDDQVPRGAVVQNCLQERLNIEKGVFGARKSFNPPQVKAALGGLVIVGQQIEFKSRIRITARTDEVVPARLVATPSNPEKLIVRQGESSSITLKGTGMLGLTVKIPDGGSELTAAVVQSSVDAKGENATITLSATDKARVGPFTITLSNIQGDSFSLTGARVDRGAVTVDKTDGITIDLQTEKSKELKLTGKFLEYLEDLSSQACSADCTAELKRSGSDTKLVVTVQKIAQPGKRTLKLTQLGNSVREIELTIKAPTPVVSKTSSAACSVGENASTLELTVEGTNLRWAELKPDTAPTGSEVPSVTSTGESGWIDASNNSKEKKVFRVNFGKRTAGDFAFKLQSGDGSPVAVKIACK